MFKANVPFLNRAELNEVVARTILKQAVDVQKVMDGERILELRKILEKVVVTDQHRDYAVRLVLATHADSEFSPEKVKKFVRWGASPRASQAMIMASRVRALADGRAHVSFEDVRYYAAEVLQHRVLLNYDGQAEGISVPKLVGELLEHIPEEG